MANLLADGSSERKFRIREESRYPDLRLNQRLFLASRTSGALGQREQNDLLARERADVMMQAQDLDTGHVGNHRLHERPGRLDQMRPNLFEEIPSFLGWK